jgi:hypothetical protein
MQLELFTPLGPIEQGQGSIAPSIMVPVSMSDEVCQGALPWFIEGGRRL